MVLISKCRGKSDVGLCTTSLIAKRILLRIGEFRLKNVFGRNIPRNCIRQHVGVVVMSTDTFEKFGKINPETGTDSVARQMH